MSAYLDIGPLQSGSGLDIGPLQSSASVSPVDLAGEADGVAGPQSTLAGLPLLLLLGQEMTGGFDDLTGGFDG